MKYIMKTGYLVGCIILFISGISLQSCTETPKKEEVKEKYVIPDSLLKKLVIDTVQKCQLVNSITLTGQVDFNQDHVIKIYPMISGIIQNVKVVLGDYVTQGQVLGIVKSSEMAGFSNDLVNAETNLQVAKKNLDATQDMFTSGLASQRDLLAAQAGYAQAKSELSRINRVLKINGGGTQGEYVIRAPISGFLVEKFVNNNTAIRSDNGTNLFTISDLKNVWVWANVYESNISNINIGDNVTITTLSYPGKIFKGKVDKILNVLDPTNKVMKVRVILPNENYALKPQMFASVTVINKENKDAICVPSGAVIFDHSQNYVLVYKSNSDIEMRIINIINTVGDKTYISSGVEPGDKLIGSQAILIYDALNS
jgi:cobalt-zinc-cadmium efflux system membrane fusion protein